MVITKEQAQRELAKRELSLRLLSYFVPQIDPFYWKPWKEYIFKPFHKILTDALERAMKWECKRIMISVPPQHWKSTISTQRFPLFAHLQDPTLNIVSASYSGDLAKAHLWKIRQIVESPQFKVLWKPLNFIKNDSQEYQLREWGSYYSVWVWWGLTWRPIDIGIIDDVHKDRAEYESDTIRNWVWDWYSSVFQSRLHKDSIIIGVMTRWWEDDLFGRILQAEWNKWEIINIPVYNEDKTETIFPERFPVDFMKEKENAMMARDFQSLYMWDPINEWGWSFKREYFMEYENHPPLDTLKIYTFVDPAISQKQEADYTAIITIGIDHNNRIYILDIFHERVEPSDSINALFEIVKQYRPERVWVEVVAFQKMLALEIRKQMTIRNTFFTLDEINPMWEKNARIKTILEPRYSNANILHPKYNKNVKDLELELLKFPNAKHDDMIDALSGAVKMAEIESIGNNDYVVTRSYNNLFK